MERLTVPAERLPDGGTRIQIVDARAVREHAMELYWRLKKYEDTGLSPDDVTDLMGSHAVAIGKLAKVPKWIPVTERLPDNEGEYLTYTDKGQMHFDCFCIYPEHGTQFWVGGNGTPTHWMPMPKPPKEVER